MSGIMRPRSLRIPVKNSDQEVEVFTDELPDDVNDIMDILRAELAALDIWLQFAVEYYNQGCVNQFQEILSVASEPGIEEIYKDQASRVCRIKFFNALACHAINSMWNEEDEKKKEAIAQRAVGYFQRADRLDHQYPMTLIGKALMFMAKNEDERAERFLKSVLRTDRQNLPALLANAMLLYRKKKYSDAKRLCLEAIKLHPKSPQGSRMRMFFSYCCYHLGCTDKARAVMKYAASLDDTNVDAVIANALWQLASLTREERAKSIRNEGSRFMTMIRHAHAIDKTNPMVLNHLANHYFTQWVPLPCTVCVKQGSNIVKTSKDVTSEISPGQIVCIGERYVTYISNQEDAVRSDHVILDGPYREETSSGVSIARKDYDKMFTLAGNAFHSTKIAEIRSESCYFMGRGCHAQGKYKDAYSYYFNAGRLWPNFVLPWFGLAQMYYERKEYGKAAINLEKANKAYPENVEILSLLGNVYGKLGKKDDAIILLRRVVDLEPGNVDALITTAELLHGSKDRKDQIIAISSYIAAEKVMKNALDAIPMELYVNLGVLQHRVGKIKEAIACFKQALNELSRHEATTESLEETKTDTNDLVQELPSPNKLNVTVLYNLARVYEEIGDRGVARTLYENILRKFPTYIDAILRLGCLKRDAGAMAEAAQYFEKALGVDPFCAEACLLHGNMHLDRREWLLAQKKYERVMGMPNMKNDPYAFLSMGNIFMCNLGEKNRYTKNMSLSEGYFKKTIQSQLSNLQAANGLGTLVAEKGNLESAKLIFTQVREASPETADAWVNLAHIFVAEERYAEAIQLYIVCLAKCYHGRDLEVMLYLAKAYYESKDYPKCIKTLSRALHINPTDLRLWYNLALAQEDYAVTTLGQESTPQAGQHLGTQRTMADVQRAVLDLSKSQKTFHFLLQLMESQVASKSKGSSGSFPFEKEKVIDHEKFCADTLTKASYHLEFERQKEEKHRLEVEAQRKMLQEYEDRVEREKESERKKDEELRRHRADVLMKQEERLKALSAGWKAREEETKKVEKKKPGKKRKKAPEDDNDLAAEASDEDNEENGTNFTIEDMKNRNATMKKLVEKRQKRENGAPIEVDEDAKQLFGSDSSDNEDEGAMTLTQSAEAKQAEQDLFGSSSDSD